MRSPVLNDRPAASRRVVQSAWLRPLALISGIGLGASALAGCCPIPMACDGINMGDDANVYFQFNTDTLSRAGFTHAQMQHAYVVRYRDEQLTQPQDSMAVDRYTDYLGYSGVRQFQLYLEADSLSRHPAYRVVVGDKRFALNHFSFEISEEKPCNCLHLRNVHFTLNSQPTVVAQDGREPVSVVLSR